MTDKMTDDELMQGYTVLELLVVGERMTDDYDESKAVEMFIRLHPEADPEAVRAELAAEITKLP
ncbi:hypothetical protein [Nevskia ramosa]|uniref:hypothetical protein n=1 Tax=Nevskia ramosa TaxID=64002 RepID=UPI003D0DB649